jgi:tRNA(Ile)-lysidine synthase
VVSLGDQLRNSGSEEKARALRYQILEEEAAAWESKLQHPVRIAVAHHSEDNAETMLLQLARGTGLAGLRGMPVKRGRVIRPFYPVSRQDIEAYLQQLHQDFCRDVTNEDVNYDRNRIRHQVLPELQQVNRQAIAHMNQTADLVAQVSDYITAQAAELLDLAGHKEISYPALEGVPSFLKREVYHLWLTEYIPGARNITAEHLQALEALEHKQVGSRLTLPRGYEARRTYTGVVLELSEKKDNNTDVRLLTAQELEENREILVPFDGKKIRFCLISYKEGQKIPRNSYTKWFDYDRIVHNIAIRYRRPGDYLWIHDSGQKQKLQDYMVNTKIPGSQRLRVPLLCDGSHVIWVVGYRISAFYKVEHKTKRVLEVQILEEEKHE